MNETTSYLRRIFKVVPLLTGIFVLITGTAALTGWLIDSAALKRFGLGEHYIQPNLAFGLVFAGAAVALFYRRTYLSSILIRYILSNCNACWNNITGRMLLRIPCSS